LAEESEEVQEEREEVEENEEERVERREDLLSGTGGFGLSSPRDILLDMGEETGVLPLEGGARCWSSATEEGLRGVGAWSWEWAGLGGSCSEGGSTVSAWQSGVRGPKVVTVPHWKPF